MTRKPLNTLVRDMVLCELNERNLTVNEFVTSVRERGIGLTTVTIYNLINEKRTSLTTVTIDKILEGLNMSLTEAALKYETMGAEEISKTILKDINQNT